ncbi:MAG: ORF6N domain-containing protein [candidate division NC10 bacterium]|nr:ORF6N domain-containing protein [candidate division NC10 bacterium]
MGNKVPRTELRIHVESLVVTLRGERVILDADLARIYGVTTGALNRAVKRNLERFPEDFVFQVKAEKLSALRCQSGISKEAPDAGVVRVGRGGRRYLPYAFTEHGALMAANVLSSARAIQMSVLVIRVFVRMRQTMAAHAQMAEKLAELDRRVAGHDEAIRSLVQTIRRIIAPPRAPSSGPPEKTRRSIGFKVEEGRPRYGRSRRVRGGGSA